MGWVMRINPKAEALLGFARKSGKLLSGESAVKFGIKTKAVKLLLLAVDMPEKRKFHWINWCKDEEIPYLFIGNKAEYARILGMSARSVVAIKDEKMAAALLEILNFDKIN